MRDLALARPLAAALIAATGLALVASVHPAAVVKCTPERASAMFSKADTNRDGVLSKEEVGRLDPALDAGFDQADADLDGKLTGREFVNLVNA